MTNLVIGGTGKTGRRVVSGLRDLGLPVRATSRSGPVPFDWTDRATWAPALDGVRAAYLTYQPDLAFPGAVEAIGELTSLAVSGGVRRLVLLSGRGEDEAAASERIVRESGLEWTILRCGFFFQNYSEGAFAEMVRAGVIALPVGGVAEPFVDADDIADAAVAALTSDRHVNTLYELTGPRLLTFADVAGELSAATGRPIRYVPVTAEEYIGMLTGYGMPATEAALLTGLFTTVLDGRNASLTDGVRLALGREPRDFTAYAKEAAASGIWKA